jgi:flagellar biogenesis protein FliO
MNLPPPLPVKRSTFLTALAWIFIALSGFASLIALMQNIMLQTLFLPEMREHPMQTMPPGAPPQMLWVFDHFQWFFRLFLLLALLHLIAAIALLLRRTWGRLLFIGVMVFDCCYQLAGVALQWWMSGAMTQIVPHVPHASPDELAQTDQVMGGMMIVMRVFSLLMALAMITLFVWIIRKLQSEPIRREFEPQLVQPTGMSL